MKNILVSWIGQTDLNAASGETKAGEGPIGQALSKLRIDLAEINLLCNYPKDKADKYLKWVKKRTGVKIKSHAVTLDAPTNFNEIYVAVIEIVERILQTLGRDETQLIFHLSPGTPAMAAVFVLLSKTRFPALLIQTSIFKGLEWVSIPLDLSADYLNDVLRPTDDRAETLSEGASPEAAEFGDIQRTSKSVMNAVVKLATRAAPHRVPVLIEGESGTGKEMLARAIHNASLRKAKAFIPVNCGAMSPNLVESELFGHTKGAFSGANAVRKGHFIEANGGTLFLDEIGELPLEMQVKLLRAIQEGEVTHVGSSLPVKVDVRIIAATNRTLTKEVAEGRFREDLFYRLAVMVLRVPPLRERMGDLDRLIDGLFAQLSTDGSFESGAELKQLSPDARALLHGHNWPGNVRELRNTLLRSMIWATGKVIKPEDVRMAIMKNVDRSDFNVLDRPLGNGFSLEDALSEVARHYLERSLIEAHGVKARATELVGLPNYQTFSNWLKKYELAE
jgi:DNA-binding NtrC family response regulator